jgi:hypothetical protein
MVMQKKGRSNLVWLQETLKVPAMKKSLKLIEPNPLKGPTKRAVLLLTLRGHLI